MADDSLLVAITDNSEQIAGTAPSEREWMRHAAPPCYLIADRCYPVLITYN